ncbi:LADA_0A08284g1_1 [Lachancea dasiensis]|uniref:LADA_0A08284g1_1 n=1 Tax=Lachancea dasiensis TaxID=1072105 RepID=A0A1G4IQR3_9SACH|nr:LADA_0A08284g1_1 [Lachancea dasiensis]
MKYLIEHLPRIGTIVVILEDFNNVRVEHLRSESVELVDSNGMTTILELPHRIDINSGRKGLQKNEGGVKTLRLKATRDVENSEDYKDRSINRAMLATPQRWMRKDLLAPTAFDIECRACNGSLISSKDCSAINELPSEFWAELMDYWHCHKPTVQHSVQVDRYSKLNPRSSELLVGNSVFCVNSTWVTAKLSFTARYVRCSKCNHTVGQVSQDGHLYNINKWNTRLVKGEGVEYFSPELHVTAILVNALNSNGTRKILLKNAHNECGILIWMFVVGLNVTMTGNQTFKNCIKVYYKRTVDAPSLSKAQNIESFVIDSVPLQHFSQKLDAVNAQLPHFLKTMDSWNLSFLHCS